MDVIRVFEAYIEETLWLGNKSIQLWTKSPRLECHLLFHRKSVYYSPWETILWLKGLGERVSTPVQYTLHNIYIENQVATVYV